MRSLTGVRVEGEDEIVEEVVHGYEDQQSKRRMVPLVREGGAKQYHPPEVQEGPGPRDHLSCRGVWAIQPGGLLVNVAGHDRPVMFH
jgi:hypothetical protein